MADIFLSYASGDRERVRPLVEALEAQGWSVWWDRHIRPGQSFDNVIQRELDDARCVVVVWTDDSVGSEWVKNEATIGLNRGVLVPALFDRVQIPLPFIRTQCADLVEWSPEKVTPEIREFLDAVAGNLEAEPQPLDIQPVRRQRRRWLPFAAGAGLLALLVAFGTYLLRGPEVPSLFDDVPEYSVAVTPFVDNTPTFDQKWVGENIGTTLRIELPARGLQVVRAAAAPDGVKPERAVKARFRIDGTVMWVASRLRVTAELYRVENDHQLWSNVFDVELDSIAASVAAQDDIAGQIANAVARRIREGDEPTLISVKPKPGQGGSLQNLGAGVQDFAELPEFPSIDEEEGDE